jgi:hypothetical protein
LTTPVRIPSRESLRDQLARLRYQWAALWHGWGETWQELAERDEIRRNVSRWSAPVARYRYTKAAKLKGWSETWEQLSEDSKETWRRRAN